MRAQIFLLLLLLFFGLTDQITFLQFSEKSIPKIIELNVVLSVVRPFNYLLRIDTVFILIEIWLIEKFFFLLFELKYG